MNRTARLGNWTNFLTGTFAGVAASAPAWALPPDLPLEVHGDMQFYALVGFGLLLVAGLVLRTLRKPPSEIITADSPVVGVSTYNTRFFPGDRRIALE